MRLILILFFIGLLSSGIHGQGKILTGKAIGSELRTKKDNLPYIFWNLPGAKILWKDSLIATADDEGLFRVQLTAEIDSIRIGWIGMYPANIRIPPNCDHVEVILLPDAIYDFVTVRKEERLRKKDRAILPELYKKAFEQGVFSQEEPCFQHEP